MRALVTGAASGLGRQLALRLAAAGAAVTAVDRRPTKAMPGVTPWIADLGERSEVDRLIADLEKEPAFDWVIHNAGVSATGRFERIPETAYLKLLTLNCETPLVMTARMCQSHRIASGGRVVFVSSLSHLTGYPGGAVYAASKDVLAVYARGIRTALAHRGIRTTTVFPGPVRTEHAARHAPPQASAARRMDPDALAGKIIRAARRGDRVLYPGLPAKIGHVAGIVAPELATRFMRRFVFERLDRDVY